MLFKHICADDHSRVVLKGDTKLDYINASYIDNYDTEKAYIASQGPNKVTIRDFWHMVWQENVGKIVMKKCERYWPNTVNEPMVVNSYIVTMKEYRKHTVYVYRLLTISNKNVKNVKDREIHHFHFTEWPDHGVPDSIKVVNFYRKVKSKACDQLGPMVVHCSAGIGRTGTFIAIDALYENGKKVGHINVMECIQMMRKDRMNMVQTYVGTIVEIPLPQFGGGLQEACIATDLPFSCFVFIILNVSIVFILYL
ncbi:PTPRT [Mytilus coruscus]|uniref:PTPRT n=1 Tax=Mytilus coruscus TaxID=42192 RepID=A0A6J8A836_MYTCO|nr:PTPRT [Mytilus coruscus]